MVLQGYLNESWKVAQEDEDFDRVEFSTNMETAGFGEPPQRLALGGVYNHMLLFSQIGAPVDNSENQPVGPVSAPSTQVHSRPFSAAG